jgi:hypothetical protein
MNWHRVISPSSVLREERGVSALEGEALDWGMLLANASGSQFITAPGFCRRGMAIVAAVP